MFSSYWLTNKVNIKRPSTGLLMYTLATRFCNEIHLYGFWPFPKDSNGNPVKYHYYDKLKYRYFSNAGPHRMPLEFKTLKFLHDRGALKLTTSKCTRPWTLNCSGYWCHQTLKGTWWLLLSVVQFAKMEHKQKGACFYSIVRKLDYCIYKCSFFFFVCLVQTWCLTGTNAKNVEF